MTNEEKMKIFEDQVLKAAEALKKCVEETKERLAPVIDALAKAAAVCEANKIDITENGICGQCKHFKECIDAGADVNEMSKKCRGFSKKEVPQDATEAAETHDFREGELIIYVNGETFQIGEIKRICDDGAFVYYHEGDTASKTPFENMHKLQNEYCIKWTSLAQDRPRCGACKHFPDCNAATDIEAMTGASDCGLFETIIRRNEP